MFVVSVGKEKCLVVAGAVGFVVDEEEDVDAVGSSGPTTLSQIGSSFVVQDELRFDGRVE